MLLTWFPLSTQHMNLASWPKMAPIFFLVLTQISPSILANVPETVQHWCISTSETSVKRTTTVMHTEAKQKAQNYVYCKEQNKHNLTSKMQLISYLEEWGIWHISFLNFNPNHNNNKAPLQVHAKCTLHCKAYRHLYASDRLLNSSLGSQFTFSVTDPAYLKRVWSEVILRHLNKSSLGL